MDFTHPDLADARESSIFSSLASEGLVLWRRDLPWSDAGVVERHLVGLVASHEGPSLFHASAWETHGRYVNTRIRFKAPLAQACAPFLPADGEEGDVYARPFHGPDTYDAAAATVAGADARYLSRQADTTSAVHLLRKGSPGAPKSIAVTVAAYDRESVTTSAELVFEVSFAQILSWAGETFGTPSMAKGGVTIAGDGGTIGVRETLKEPSSMSRPTIFVRIHQGQVVDVCSEDPDVQVFVIDEDKPTSEIPHEDGTSFGAQVMEVQVTAPHFDPVDVVDVSVGTMSNGVFEAREDLSPFKDDPKGDIARSLHRSGVS